MTIYIHDDWPKGEVPKGSYAQSERSPIVWIRLCAGCAGFAPFTDRDYDGYLTGRCQGCGMNSRELHRFRAFIDSASGCSCETHGDPSVGDLAAENVSNRHSSQRSDTHQSPADSAASRARAGST